MENPVVVFVLKDRCGDKTLVFPTGWTKQGKRLSGSEAIRGNNCCVILLADDEEIPHCDHANKDVNQPLPVITHENSGLYTEATILNSGLSTWGKPVWIDDFSHYAGAFNGIFEEVKNLLRDPSGADGFAQHHRATNDFDLLDQLAAICQICMIDPNDNNVTLGWAIFNKLPDGEFKDQLEAAMTGSWPEALGFIVARANELPSKPLNQKNEYKRQDLPLATTRHDS